MAFTSKSGFARFAAAAIMYGGFAVYLLWPHFKTFSGWERLIGVNLFLASSGVYVLSRRWVSAFAGSFLGGALYGFGPFMLGLAKFHPTAGLLAAGVPWLLCPAAFGARARWRRVSPLFVVLPFLAIVLFFQVTVHYRLFAVSTQTRLGLADLQSLLAPLVIVELDASRTILGFYHIPIAALIMGCCMLLAARRVGILAVVVLGVVLACCESFLNISPIVWLAIPVACFSVLIGVGLQGLASAGYADRKWVLPAGIVMGILAIVALMFATEYFQTFLGLGSKYARLLVEAARMYILGAVAVAIIFFMERARVRGSLLRWVVLCSTVGLDIFIGAGFIIDRIL